MGLLFYAEILIEYYIFLDSKIVKIRELNKCIIDLLKIKMIDSLLIVDNCTEKGSNVKVAVHTFSFLVGMLLHICP